jgi:hypothetical protein
MLLRGFVGAAGTVLFVYAGELLPSTVRATVVSFSICLGRLATMAGRNHQQSLHPRASASMSNVCVCVCVRARARVAYAPP